MLFRAMVSQLRRDEETDEAPALCQCKLREIYLTRQVQFRWTKTDENIVQSQDFLQL